MVFIFLEIATSNIAIFDRLMVRIKSPSNIDIFDGELYQI